MNKENQKIYSNLKNSNQLSFLEFNESNLVELPEGLKYLSQSLRVLSLSRNPLPSISPIIGSLTLLQDLDLSYLPITDLPMEFSNLKQLGCLTVEGNVFKKFPKAIKELPNLQTLIFSSMNYKIIEEHEIANISKIESIILTQYSHLVSVGIDKMWITDIFKKIAKKNNNYLTTGDELREFYAEMYKKLPRLISWNVLDNLNKKSFSKIQYLNLSSQSFKTLDSSIKYLINLNWLDLSHNLMLEELSSKIADLPLESLSLENCPSLKTPPKEIVNKGVKAILGYMKVLNKGSASCRRTKLMLVGLGGAGKTSLVSALTENNQLKCKEMVENTIVTDGISIKKWNVQSIEYSIWDFAGQTVYYNTHQFFLSNRAVYLLVWNVRLGHEHAGLEFWLSSIECHAPKAPIFIVGTHIDQVCNKINILISHQYGVF